MKYKPLHAAPHANKNHNLLKTAGLPAVGLAAGIAIGAAMAPTTAIKPSTSVAAEAPAAPKPKLNANFSSSQIKQAEQEANQASGHCLATKTPLYYIAEMAHINDARDSYSIPDPLRVVQNGVTLLQYFSGNGVESVDYDLATWSINGLDPKSRPVSESGSLTNPEVYPVTFPRTSQTPPGFTFDIANPTSPSGQSLLDSSKQLPLEIGFKIADNSSSPATPIQLHPATV